MTNLDMMAFRQRVNMYRSTMENKSTDHKACLSHACEIIDELLVEVEHQSGLTSMHHRHLEHLQDMGKKWRQRILSLETERVQLKGEMNAMLADWKEEREGLQNNEQFQKNCTTRWYDKYIEAKARIKELEKRTHLLDES